MLKRLIEPAARLLFTLMVAGVAIGVPIFSCLLAADVPPAIAMAIASLAGVYAVGRLV
jgi:glutamate mutase epsilon subunit